MSQIFQLKNITVNTTQEKHVLYYHLILFHNFLLTCTTPLQFLSEEIKVEVSTVLIISGNYVIKYFKPTNTRLNKTTESQVFSIVLIIAQLIIDVKRCQSKISH